jgi:ABC-type multidrug transport system ATPase subunit
LLLLDEPMAGLDPSQVRAVQGLISGRPEGQTVILSSNRLEAINPLCDRVVVIVGGEVAVDNSPSSENDAAGLYFSAVGSLDDEQRSVGEKT